MSNVFVSAAFVSSESARTAPSRQLAVNQRYAAPECVTFEVSGYMRFSVELTRSTRRRIQACGGIKGSRTGRRVTFTSDYHDEAIPPFTVSLTRARAPRTRRRSSYPKSIVAKLVGYHQIQTGSDYVASFEVDVNNGLFGFSITISRGNFQYLERKRFRMSGILNADGVATFTLPRTEPITVALQDVDDE